MLLRGNSRMIARSTGLHGPVRIETLYRLCLHAQQACSTGLHGPVRIETWPLTVKCSSRAAAPAFTGR